jgi:hypothetical protein
VAAGPFEAWVRGLRISWLKGAKGQAIAGAFARVMGDLSVAWADRAQLQHFPADCEAEALPLLGSERGLPQGPTETDADYRIRLTQAIPLWRRAGSPLGLLLALHYEGFSGAVIVQQNGCYFELTDPDPISPVQTKGDLGERPVDGHPWWTFDNDDAWCSRFAILFPAGVGIFTRVGWAVFDGTEDGATVPWPTVTWSTTFDDATYLTLCGAPVTADGPVSVAVDASSKTAASVQVAASGSFVGTVPVIAWPAGENPFAWASSADLAKLARIVKAWKPAKAKCMGAFVLVAGEMWDWPVGTWDEPGGIWGPPGEVVIFTLE